MMEIGRLCVKIAGRDAGNHCVIVDVIDDNFVMIDGNVPRKRCNVKHLEPLNIVLKIKKGASTDSVHEAMKSERIKVFTKKSKAKKAEKPVKQRKKKVKEPAVKGKKPKKTKA
jgi:large subunit ribosomal protein L14e